MLGVQFLYFCCTKVQWRIQDFPRALTPEGIIWPIIPENCKKMKKFWPWGVPGTPIEANEVTVLCVVLCGEQNNAGN